MWKNTRKRLEALSCAQERKRRLMGNKLRAGQTSALCAAMWKKTRKGLMFKKLRGQTSILCEAMWKNTRKRLMWKKQCYEADTSEELDWHLRNDLDILRMGAPWGPYARSLRIFFGRRRSRLVGSLSRMPLSKNLRVALFKLYARTFGVELHELKQPLESFKTLSDFFSRELREGARPIAQIPRGLVAPADSKILSMGTVTDGNSRVDQVKGATYSVRSLLGMDPTAQVRPGYAVRYVVLYLAPGDYHRMHSPCDLEFKHGRHFPGEFFPLKSTLLKNMNDLFCINERVVLSGNWKEGQMHFVAVAAANVGDIFLSFDPTLKTNTRRSTRASPLRKRGFFTKMYPDGISLNAGSEVGGFRLGSTVVLVFESPEDFQWQVKMGDKVRVGQPLGKSGD